MILHNGLDVVGCYYGTEQIYDKAVGDTPITCPLYLTLAWGDTPTGITVTFEGAPMKFSTNGGTSYVILYPGIDVPLPSGAGPSILREVTQDTVTKCGNFKGSGGVGATGEYVYAYGGAGLTSAESMFEGVRGILNLDWLDTSNVTNMDKMFTNMPETLLEIGALDTSSCTSMNSMFMENWADLDLTNFDTSKVTDMEMMFHRSAANVIDTSSFDTSKVTNMGEMFSHMMAGIESLDLSNFDTSNVTDMKSMFSCGNHPDDSFISLDVSSFRGDSVTNTMNMFGNCKRLLSVDLTNFNTPVLDTMFFMFIELPSATSIKVDSMDVSGVTDFDRIFLGCSSLTNLNLSSWRFDSATRFLSTFGGCSSLTCITNLNTHHTSDKISIFDDCTSLVRPNGWNADHSAYTGECADLTDSEGANWVNDAQCGDYIPVPIVPSVITDLKASEVVLQAVRITFTDPVGIPAPTVDLYTGTTLLATDILTGYYDAFVGTRDYHLKAVNSEGSTDSNIDLGTGLPPYPGDITDFDASDGNLGVINVTWSDSTYADSYDLYAGTTLLVAGITSGYAYGYEGSIDLHVKAINVTGVTDSNVDTGFGEYTAVPLAITDFNATDSELEEIILTWSTPYNAASCDIYKGGVLLASDASSPFTETITGTSTYYVRAINTVGGTDSNSDSGTGLVAQPGYISDFNATDGEDLKVVCTWSDAEWAESYDLYKNNILLATDVTSGYADEIYIGTAVYKVYANNKGLTTVSNSNNGTGVLANHFYAVITMGAYDSSLTYLTDVDGTGTGFEWSEDNGVTWNVHTSADVYFPEFTTIIMRKLDGALNVKYSYFLTAIDEISAYGSTSTERMFSSTKLTSIDLTNFNTDNIISAGMMFSSCALITNYNLTNCSFRLTNDMYGMFGSNNIITHIDLSAFDFNTTPKSFEDMFHNNIALQCISNIDTTNATNRDELFASCTALVRPNAAEQADIIDVDGANWVNDWPNCPTQPDAPEDIIDFSASDNLTQQVQVTWTNPEGAVSYDLYSDTTLLVSGIQPGYVNTYTGTRNYHVVAIGPGGESTSNVDSGTGIVPLPGPISDFNATDDELAQVTCTWSASSYAASYDVYRASVKIATDVTSPYVDSPFEGTANYKVHAVNVAGETISNNNSGSGGKSPGVVVNFNATDNEVGKVTCTWTNTTGDPIPTYDLYTGVTLLEADVVSGVVDIFEGTRDYHVKAVNIYDSIDSNIDSGTGTPPAPGFISDFNASDGADNIVTCTWSPATDAASYNLYRDNVLATVGVTSPHGDSFIGTATYRVRAINAGGHSDSNSDTGSAVIPVGPPSAITDFNASDDKLGKVECTWSLANADPIATYDLYSGVTLLASGVTTYYDDSYEGVRDYHVKAANSEGSTDSNIDSGTGLAIPGAITDFNATDNEIDQITCTWSNATGVHAPTYNVYENGVLIATDATSPYIHLKEGTADYYVRAVNSVGTSQSNTDSGSGVSGFSIVATKLPAEVVGFFGVGGDMRYSNDGGSTFITISDGVATTLEVGVGPYILREVVLNSITEISSTTTHIPFRGDMVIKGGSALVSTTLWFSNLDPTLTSLDITALDTSNVVNMKGMFDNFNAGIPVELHNLSTASATNMAGMFKINDMSTIIFPVDFGIVATDMVGMFEGSTSNTVLDLSNFAPAAAGLSVDNMFKGNTSLTSIRIPANGFNGADSFVDMFLDCTALTCITNIDTTSNVGDTSTMFSNTPSLVRPDAGEQALIVGIGGDAWINDQTCGGYLTPVPPSVIADLSATDDEKEQVTITWTASIGGPTPSHAIYGGGTLLDDNASSPYVDMFVGTRDYTIIATNSEGTANSNTDSGTGLALEPPTPIVDLVASDTTPEQVTITWTNSTGGTNMQQDIYGGGVLLDSDVTSPYIDYFIGTKDYYVVATNDDGTETSNTDSGTGAPALVAPSAIVDFAASDDTLGGVTVTFTPATGNPVPTHDLYVGTTLIQAGIDSGYVDSYVGTRSYHVKAINSVSTVDSNIDSGTGTQAPTAIIDFDATDGLDNKITCTWSPATGVPDAIVYDLYEGITLIAGNVTSPYDYIFTGTAVLKVRATNAVGVTDSNNDTGEGLIPLPIAITDFSATDTQEGQVTCTWSTSVGADSYDLYKDTVLLAIGVTSGYIDVTEGTSDYKVRAINARGFTDSNVDSGTGTIPVLLEITWDGLTATSKVTIIGGSMDYSKDGGSSWVVISAGYDVYIAAGTGPYILREQVYGEITQCGFTNTDAAEYITGTMAAKGGGLTTGYSMFKDLINITSLDVADLITSNMTYTTGMFSGCNLLTSLDVSSLNTSNVTSMSSMFYNCSALTDLDVSNFNTSNTTDIRGMFRDCSALTNLDLSNFNTSKVTDMEYMVYNCNSLISLDVTNFNTSKVTDMSSMFGSCSSLTSLDVSSFDTGNNTHMLGMFSGCSSLTSLDVTNFDTTKVVGMHGTFASCSSLTSLDVTNFVTSSVATMRYMFDDCTSLTSLDLTGFNTSNVTTMTDIFSDSIALTSLDLTSFDTTNVTSMYNMFNGCTSLTCISNLDTTSATVSKAEMFTDCPALVQPDATAQADLVDENGANWTNPWPNCPLAPPEVLLEITWDGLTDDTEVTIAGGSMDYSTDGGSTWSVIPTGIDESLVMGTGPYILKEQVYGQITQCGFDDRFAPEHITGAMVAKGGNGLTTGKQMLKSLTNITSLDVTGLITTNMTDMEAMFSGSAGFTSLDLTNFDTTNATGMLRMFYNCEELTSLDLTSFNTTNVLDMGNMFQGCEELTSLDLTSFNTTNVTNMNYMFDSCTSLTSLDLTSFITSSALEMDNMFDSCTNLVCITNLNTVAATVDRLDIFLDCTSLVQPDAAAQTDLTDSNGANWVNANPCP